MTRRINVILCIALSFMLLFITVGYSALTTDLSVKATLEYEIPKGLYITDAKYLSMENGDHYDISFVQYTTTVDCTVDKKDDDVVKGNWWNGWKDTITPYAGSFSFEITVFNNTDYEYAYRTLFYQTSLQNYNGNSYVSKSNSDNRLGVVVSFPNNDSIVGPGETLTFTATYTVGTGMEDTTDWKTLINFQFGINLESEAAARNAVHDKFLDILNTTVTYEELVDRLDDKYDGNQEWTSNYIGNVSSAVDADSMTVETLFAGQLNMIIDGKITPASVLIKHENLDNDYTTGDDYSVVNNQGQTVTYRGCEMTLYLTTDPLDTPNSWAPVYVTVFTCDRDSEGNLSDWYPIGDTYVGEANIVGYNGANGGTGSFVTDNWRSDAAGYTPVSNYSYNVGNDYSIKAIVQTVDPAAETAFQSLLDRSKKLIDDERFAGEGIEALEDAYEEAARYYTIDADGRAIANQGVTRVRLIPVMADLDHALNTAIDYIREKYPNEEID